MFRELFIDDPLIACIDSIDKLVMIDERHLLVFRPGLRRLFLLQIDYETWKVNVLDSLPLDMDLLLGELLLDAKDQNKFMIFVNRTACFALGRIVKNKIILNTRQQSNALLGLKYKKLAGQTLSGMKFEEGALKFCEVELDSLNQQLIEIPALMDKTQKVNIQMVTISF